jgi:hypothetical protein
MKFSSIVLRFFAVFRRTFRDKFCKTLENKENNNGKFHKILGWAFYNFYGEKSNVKTDKMRKAGGGGLSGVKS